MTAKLAKTLAGLTAALSILGGSALAQQDHVTAQDPNFILTALYAQMDAARERTSVLVLAKAESDIQMTMLRTDALYAFRPNLGNRFVLAHLEP